MRVGSTSPASIAWQSAAISVRSRAVFGIKMPLLVCPTLWPARPTRCRPRATLPGDSTWQTRSTAPMSMPISSDAVATTARRRPSFRASSVSFRFSNETLPWWAWASIGSSSPLIPAVMRSEARRSLLKMRVLVCDSVQDLKRRYIDGHTDFSGKGPNASTGCTTDKSSDLRRPASRMLTGRLVHTPLESSVPPPRKRAMASSGRCVADRPMRCSGGALGRAFWMAHSRRSRSKERNTPRLTPHNA